MPPHGNSKDEEFDPSVHLEIEPEKDPNADSEEEEPN
jgi:hypothetical protein